MVWFFYAILAAISASFVTIFSKLGINNLSPSLAATVKAIIMAVFLIGVSVVRGDFVNFTTNIINYKKDFLFLVLTGVCGALSWLFMNIALKYGKVTQVAPIDKLSVVFTVIISILIFKESISVKGMLGVIFIAIGAILVALY
ncbi:EamA family transporter [Clostridium sp.]|uniref:EamA family transporter n=1 Tax=Clostridium sp. TaxID=1506 RepID=UPI003991D3F1